MLFRLLIIIQTTTIHCSLHPLHTKHYCDIEQKDINISIGVLVLDNATELEYHSIK